MTDQQPHTPTKAEIMDSYRRGRVWATPNGGRTYASEFERWYKKVIAAAEQRGAIKALREAADEFAPEWPDKPDLSATRGVSQTRKWLHNRADLLEGDDE